MGIGRQTDQPAGQGRTLYVLLLLTLTAIFTSIDRSILWVLAEPIKLDLGLSDGQVGLLSGFAFALVYSLTGVPFGYLADRANRKWILATCLAVWSALTAVCGFAGSFSQLFLARILVGGAESSAGPTSMSIISDLFRERRRGFALGCYMAGVSLGIAVVFMLGGWIAQTFGWRSTFLIAGLPGILLALVIALTMREPARPAVADGAPTASAFGETLRFIAGQRTVHLLYATLVFSTIISSGVSTFFVSFMVRSHGMGLATAGQLMGVASLAGALGTLLVGLLGDRLGQRDRRWPLWLSAMLFLGAQMTLIAIVLTSSLVLIILLAPIWQACASAWNGASLSVLHSLVPPRMRGVATSIHLVLASLLGVGVGATWLGFFSDWLVPFYGSESLRHAILFSTVLYLVAIAALLLATRSLQRDLARAATPPVPVGGASLGPPREARA